MKIGIVGYGYVGKGMARMFSDHDVRIYDPHIAGQYDNPAHVSDEAGVMAADLVLVCVPTPACGHGADTSAVVQSVERFAKAKLICIKSTVPPGTTQKLIDRYGHHVHFSPEYMGEGANYVDPSRYPDPRDAKSHPFCIVGGDRTEEVLAIFQRVMATSARYIPTTATAAELCKYMENTFLAMKVAFCNDWYDICKAHGVTYNAVRELWLADPRVDPSHTLVFPDQRGFDGKCLPKDLHAIIMAAAKKGVEPHILIALQGRQT